MFKSLIAIVLIGICGHCLAADFASGVKAYKAGEYEQAIAIFSDLALKRDSRAQFALGLLHDRGDGVPVDDTKARYWYQRSADQGYAKAQYNLAAMFESGEGGARDPVQARRLYASAARAGNADALEYLMGVAAEGDSRVQLELGLMYFHGEGVPRDYDQSRHWLELSATADEPRAWFALGTLAQKRAGKKAGTEAVQAYQRAAELGYADGLFNLSIMYRDGDDVEADRHQANDLMLRAAEAGSTLAALRLAMMYDLGIDVPADPKTAEQWYEVAARSGEPRAMNNLAIVLLSRTQSEPQPVSALAWFSVAADKGLSVAQVNAQRLGDALDDAQLSAAKDLAKQWEQEFQVNR